jgi:hypothetical protein
MVNIPGGIATAGTVQVELGCSLVVVNSTPTFSFTTWESPQQGLRPSSSCCLSFDLLNTKAVELTSAACVGPYVCFRSGEASVNVGGGGESNEDQ